jgi:hypothetical protein
MNEWKAMKLKIRPVDGSVAIATFLILLPLAALIVSYFNPIRIGHH